MIHKTRSNRFSTLFSTTRFRALTLGIIVVGLILISAVRGATSGLDAPVQAAASYDWLQFYGDARHSGNNTLETQITAQNVGSLVRLFQATLPATEDGAPAILTGVSTSSGIRDLAFATTKSGHIVALDAHTGEIIWSHQPSGPNITHSSPAIDPSRAFVYSYGLDGYVHKYAVGSGAEVTGGGWPQLATLKPSVEKGGTSITILSVGGATYLYQGVGGYIGDAGDYQGHVVTVDLATGVQRVFNTLCSDQTVHFTLTTPDCPEKQGAVWARSGVVYDTGTNRIYFVTGNADFNPAGHHWGDTVLAINPDGTGVNGGPVDSYTPSNYQMLQDRDLDLGSAAPAIVPGSTKYPHIAVQSGKDARLRILNLDNLSGQGGPGNVGGELANVALPQGGQVQNAVPVWTNPADNTTWIFPVSPTNGIAGLRLVFDASGNPSLSPVWQRSGGGGSALIANNVLYFAQNGNFQALNPTTGAQLWNNTGIGSIHWQSPVVANGIVYIADNSNHLTAFSLSTSTLTPSPTRTPTPTITPSLTPTTQAPYGGTPAAIPGTIQAENYDTGGEGVAYHDTTSGNSGNTYRTDGVDVQTTTDSGGGYNVGWTAAGEWLEYTVNVAAAGSYTLNARVASQSSGGTLHVEVDGVNVTGAMTIPSTGGWQTWTTVTRTGVSLTAGQHVLRIAEDSAGFNVNWLSFTGGTPPVTTPPVTTPPVTTPPVTTPPVTTPPPGTVSINAGGPATGSFTADQYFSGGSTYTNTRTIDMSQITTNPPPAAVFNTERYGAMTYTIPNLTAGRTYTVTLYFAETYVTAAGQRLFNVSINGAAALSNFDIFASAGGANRAIARSFTTTANSSGQVVIQFISGTQNPKINGITVAG